MSETAVVCISKRCVKCGVQPAPSDMDRLWGWKWQDQTMCSNCRYMKDGQKILVIMVPKLKGMDGAQIQEWYIPLELRKFAQKTYIDEPSQTKIYLSDGDRFWCWSDWPHRWQYFIEFDKFIKACPDWKMISPYVAQAYPEIKDYVSC